jgi:hypothetical protein
MEDIHHLMSYPAQSNSPGKEPASASPGHVMLEDRFGFFLIDLYQRKSFGGAAFTGYDASVEPFLIRPLGKDFKKYLENPSYSRISHQFSKSPLRL